VDRFACDWHRFSTTDLSKRFFTPNYKDGGKKKQVKKYGNCFMLSQEVEQQAPAVGAVAGGGAHAAEELLSDYSVIVFYHICPECK
jgi:hypothetical protein